MKSTHILLALAVIAGGMFLFAGTPMKVTLEGLEKSSPIPDTFELCKPTENGKSTKGENKRPTIAWSGAPKDTQSFALLMTDPDVPADFTDAGKDGKTLAADMPRQLFYHWALVDIPADVTRLEGGDARKNPPVGKALKSDLGSYVPNAKNYGGPCPPWNDLRLHTYDFTVYALDVKKLELKPDATARDAAEALKPHTLKTGVFSATYTLNPALRK